MAKQELFNAICLMKNIEHQRINSLIGIILKVLLGCTILKLSFNTHINSTVRKIRILQKNTMKLVLYMFISLSSNGDNIGTTDYVVYQEENVLTLEVL